MAREQFISVVIPNYNKSATIERCLSAAYASDYNNFEVVVVDDCSTDNSVEMIKKFPCRLVLLEKRGGAAKARNIGAEHSRGEMLFFVDADCILQRGALAIANERMRERREVFGGTYTKIPYDGHSFYSTFQSIYVNYAETKRKNAEYIAAHCLVIHAELFRKSGGFAEDSSVEDVEFSHRLRSMGCELRVYDDLLVQHVFNFSLLSSLRNAFKKSAHWTAYSIKNGDLTRDSGAASMELKANVILYFTCAILALAYLLSGSGIFGLLTLAALVLNLFTSRRLIAAFNETKGKKFAAAATAYYVLAYPVAVGLGAMAGFILYALKTWRGK